MPRFARTRVLALAALLALGASPASATIGARWSEPVTRWQPILVPRDAASAQWDLVNLTPDGGQHPQARLQWIRTEDGVVRATSTTSHMDDNTLLLGAIPLANGTTLPDVITWTTGGVNDELQCWTAPGPGGPGPGFTDRAPAWRILVPTSGGAMPPIYFENVENGPDLEIVIHSPRDYVSVYDRNGVLLQGINLSQEVGGDRFTDYVVYPGDTDGDGRSELFVQYPDFHSTSGVVVGVLGSTSPTAAPPAALRGAPSLAPLAPNPMHARSLVSWTLPQAGHASVRVFDAAGRQVRTLMNGSAPAGTYSQAWDGNGDDGRRLPPGVYLVEVAALGQRQSRKAVVLK